MHTPRDTFPPSFLLCLFLVFPVLFIRHSCLFCFDSFKSPFSNTRVSFFFFSVFVSRYLYADPLHCNMTYLFLRLLKDDLKEYTYAARLAGLSYGIASGMNAILVSMARPLIHHVWQGKGVGMLETW